MITVESNELKQLLRELGGGTLRRVGDGSGLSAALEVEYRDWVLHDRLRQPVEARANVAGQESIAYTQGAAGGFFVAPGMHDRFFEAMRQHDQIFEDWASNVVETATGTVMPFPAADDVANASVQVSETAQSNEVDVANFGTTQLSTYAFRTKLVAISLELLQDSAFPIGAFLERVFAYRHARGVGRALILGTGVAQPTGLLTAVVASGAVPVIANGASTNTGNAGDTGAVSLGTNDFYALYLSLNPMYRDGAVFAMTDGTLRSFARLLDKNGRPLFTKGVYGDGETFEPTIFGHRVAVCPSIPELGTGPANIVILYNPSYFIQRRVPSATFVRKFWQAPGLVQSGLIGFESWMRVDSNLIAPNPSFVPCGYIQAHS